MWQLTESRSLGGSRESVAVERPLEHDGISSTELNKRNNGTEAEKEHWQLFAITLQRVREKKLEESGGAGEGEENGRDERGRRQIANGTRKRKKANERWKNERSDMTAREGGGANVSNFVYSVANQNDHPCC